MTTLRTPASCLHVSNLLTYTSLLSGVTALAAATHGSGRGAGACIAVSVLADTFDGRFAGLFARDRIRREFGAQLDSLSDAVTFGIVPAVCLLLLSGQTGLVAWAAAFVYALCATTRLGFYNITHADVEYFVGLPVPVAALIVSSALLATPSSAIAIVLLLSAGAAMIAPWRIARPTGAALLLFALWPAGLALAHLVACLRQL